MSMQHDPESPPGPPLTVREPETARPGRPLLIGLSVLCAVLLLATIGLAITSFRLLTAPVAASEPSPSPSVTAPGRNGDQSVLGVDITIHSELEFGEVAVSARYHDRFTAVFAPMTWADDTEAATVAFDLTAYDADGRIIERELNLSYVLPGQEAMFYTTFDADISEATTIAIEQTGLERSSPSNAGGITLSDVDAEIWPWLTVSATSTLTSAVEYPDLYVVGYVDGDVFGVCTALATVPAGGDFEANCDVVAASSSEEIIEVDELPEDAEFTAFITLDAP